MQYQIKSVDAASGSMSVRFFDGQDEIVVAIDLPVVDGAFPAGEDLNQLIKGYAPTYFFSRTRSLDAGVDTSYIVSLIDQINDI